MKGEKKLQTPFKDLLPPLPTEVKDRLKADIVKHGQRDPVLVAGDIILDGHHRYEILGSKARIQQIDVAEDERDAFAIAVNLNRRNLSPEERADVRDKQKAIALRLKRSGRTQVQVASILRVAQRTISYWLEDESDSSTANTLPGLDRRTSLTPKDKDAIAERVQNGETQAQVAADYGIKPQRVGQIVQQERKRAENTIKQDSIRESIVKDAGFEGLYRVLVIDPPWPMEKIEREVRPNQSRFDYPTETEDQLLARKWPAKADAHVWLWTTHRFLPMAFRLLEAWGFSYVCTFVWHKPGGFQPVGLPQFNCEFALYARCGSPAFDSTKALPVCFEAKRTRHSEKPEVFYDLVRKATHTLTKRDRIDIYNRREIPGFTGWPGEAKQ